MLTSVAFGLLAVPLTLLVWTARSLAENRAIAQKSGLPLLIRWNTPTNPIWMFYGNKIVALTNFLGFRTKLYLRYYFFGWEGNERYDAHQDFGDVFMVVSPGGNWLCVSDADTAYEILQRRSDFRRNVEQMGVLNVYGKNLSTTDGQEWQKHRKVTAVTFTEKNNELVWQASLRQAHGMLQYWMKRSAQPIRSVAADAKVFTLNVLAAALFSKEYPFESREEPKTGGKRKDNDRDSYSYRDSLSSILTNIILIFVFGSEKMKAWWTPESWKRAAGAVQIFRSYVTGLIEEEKGQIKQGDTRHQKQDLVSALVRACEPSEQEDEKHAGEKMGLRKMTLTEEEIISNLFVYAFAGNDTTAISFSHIIVELAANPQTQEWIGEEIDYYLSDADFSH